ncbi:MAG: helix-turn-helix domain-containing protein [archaeon]
MGLFTLLKRKKKEEQKESTIVKEDVAITMMRELLGIRFAVDDLKRAMHDDHHRILTEFDLLPKRDDLRDALGEKIERLRGEKEKLEKEIELTELQRKILDYLEHPITAAELAKALGKSRTWVSQQVNRLVDAGMVKTKKEGKFLKYYTETEGLSAPPKGAL